MKKERTRDFGIKQKCEQWALNTKLHSYHIRVLFQSGLGAIIFHYYICVSSTMLNIFSLDYVTDYHKFRCCWFFSSSSWICVDKLSVGIYNIYAIQRCVRTINISIASNAENVNFIDSNWNQIPFYSSH